MTTKVFMTTKCEFDSCRDMHMLAEDNNDEVLGDVDRVQV